MRYESAVNSAGGDYVTLLNPSSLRVKAQFSIGTLYYNHIQSAVGSISRQSSFKHSRYFMKQQLSHQICTTASRRIESHCGTL
jgi:hypothetical protein